MSWKSAFDMGAQSAAAIAAATLEAQVAIGDAADEKAWREAQLAFQNRVQDSVEHSKEMDNLYRYDEMAERRRQFDVTDEANRWSHQLTIDGQKYIIDEKTKSAYQIAGLESETGKYVADQRRKGTETTAEAGKEVAGIRADADMYGADQQRAATQDTNRSREKVAETEADAALRVARQNYEATVDATRIAGEQDRETLREEYEIARTQRAERMLNRALLGTASDVPSLQKEGRDWAMKVIGEITSSESYKYLESAQLQWQVIEAGKQGFGGMSDLVLINAFQRMIDPGVSVREGDAELQRLTSSYLDELQRRKERILAEPGAEANLLTRSARAGLIESAQNILNGQIDAYYNNVMKSANNLLALEPELAQSGISFQQLVPNIFQKRSVNPYRESRIPEEQWPARWRDGNQGTVPDVENLIGGKMPQSAVRVLVERMRAEVAAGGTVDEARIEAGLMSTYKFSEGSAELEEAMKAVIEAFNAQVRDEPPTQTPSPTEPAPEPTPEPVPEPAPQQDGDAPEQGAMEDLDAKYAAVSDVDLRRQMLADGLDESLFEAFWRWRQAQKEG